ncbi:glucose/arabinose dehydrogenase [Chitinophagaceae bacterium OAS944]|uniref:PQQ-dependent sugar dehydrogenase n=2 Tax=Niastella sp. OAS944 TaxID=2664089 RepID=UPI0035C7FA18|nr:glucose/arabinose dehydrogenase [Chitinophagaceae bacterium OAS944]
MKVNLPANASRATFKFLQPGVLVVLSVLLIQSCQKSISHDLRTLDMQLVAEDFVSPIQLVSSNASQRLYVVDQIGKIWTIDKDGYKNPTPFLDISSKIVSLNPDGDERGLLGLAFHKDFKTNGRFFIYYQLPPRAGGPVPGATWNNLSRVSEFNVIPDAIRADPNSEKVILEWDDPQGNHNGGSLAFGHDNYLYIAVGDGGGANDVGPGHFDDWYTPNAGGNAQNLEANFLGKILCIDIDVASPYGIPPANPFVGKPGLDEIWAFGFRNPYRMSFDMGESKELIAGDAGQSLWEEIDVVKKGGNYGWNVREGRHCFNAADNTKELAGCPDVDDRGKRLLNPVIELNNWKNPAGGKATTIIGGYVYRGEAIKEWQGKYIFGTFSQTATTPDGQLFIATPTNWDNTGSWEYKPISLASHTYDLGYFLRGFGQDEDGEVYITVSSNAGPQGNTGKVYKLVKN